MRKVIFGASCIVGGLLLVLIMLFVGAYPNATSGLNFVGNLFIWLGVIASIVVVILCLVNLKDD